MKHTTLNLIILCFLCTFSFSQESKEIDVFLQKFQDGYSRRDTSVIELWCNSMFAEDVQIIFTGALMPGERGWEFGHDAAKRLFKSDWAHWGDLNCFWEEAETVINGKSAWVQMAATLSKTDQFERTYARCFNRIKAYADDSDINARGKLEKILWDVSTILHQTGRGEKIIWPVRISMGLQKIKNEWKIQQIHFSYPTQGFPLVRFSEKEAKSYENKLSGK